MFKYYFKRYSVFLFFYVALGLIVTFVLGIKDFVNLDTSFWALSKTGFSGIAFLLMEFCFAAVPLSAYLFVLPKKFHNSVFDKYFTGVMFVIFFYLITFISVSQYFFWDEFSSRFNFIAVDYLVYTQEVIANIYQSYPIVTILLCIFVLSIAIWYLFRNTFTCPKCKAPSAKKRLLVLAVNILLCAVIVRGTSISWGDVTNNRYNNELAKSGPYCFVYAFFHNELDYKSFFITEPQDKADKILAQKLQGPKITFKNGDLPYYVKSSGKEIKANVVIVLMESMGAKFLDATKDPGEPEVTPNLSRLASEGVYFPHAYSTGTRTVRGIEAVTLSMPPLPGMSIVRRQGNENLHGIGSIFNDRGYKSEFLYGGFGYFDNMNHYFGSNGFDIVDRMSLEDDEITFSNAWGVCDEDIFARAIKEADKTYKQKKPFFQFILTTSNHRPFTYPAGKIDIASGTGRRGAVKYSDYAVGKFIKDASKKPWFDNTVFVFVADHGPGSSGKQELAPKEHRIPVIIYAPKIFKAKTYDMPVSQMDVAPTLLSLLNFSYKSNFFGRDATQKDYKTRIFINNYQDVGMIEDGIMTVLKPVKQVDFFKGDSPNPLPDKQRYQPYLDTAVSYLQKADQWKLHLRK